MYSEMISIRMGSNTAKTFMVLSYTKRKKPHYVWFLPLQDVFNPDDSHGNNGFQVLNGSHVLNGFQKINGSHN